VEGSKTRKLSTFVWCSRVAPAPSAPPLAFTAKLTVFVLYFLFYLFVT